MADEVLDRSRRWTRYAYPLAGFALGGIGVVQLMAEASSFPWLGLNLIAALVNGCSVALLRRQTLVGTLGVSGVIAVMAVTRGVPVFASFVGAVFTALTIARYGSARSALVGYPALVAATAVVAVREVTAGTDSLFNVVYPIVYFGGAGLLGWLARQRAAQVRAAAEYAAALERERVYLAEIAAAQERTKIARDLHDVISHGVSLMVVQAEAAREVLATGPEHVGPALDAISAAGRAAIGDLGQMLGVLRRTGDGAHIATLLAPVRAAGITVDLVETGTPPDDQAVRTVAYRIVQEALTNTMKHGRATHVTVRVEYGRQIVLVEVLDDGVAGGTPDGGGVGLVGMRERAEALGGDVEAGPRTDGPGFRVQARLPVPASGMVTA
ncbi:two-component sensor histidine kinase [Planotetraspora thailandica]|uniref:histidine kinase n=1 Tax=Planotetraspora thailandica TaxID=487172 RepID=A0A8J3V6L8_9ACTN|nr:histidine kinase [Planotetraspora thailandica]GII57956.1 two-component sensor histidine kinase [Planotetraspora thailandica]